MSRPVSLYFINSVFRTFEVHLIAPFRSAFYNLSTGQRNRLLCAQDRWFTKIWIKEKEKRRGYINTYACGKQVEASLEYSFGGYNKLQVGMNLMSFCLRESVFSSYIVIKTLLTVFCLENYWSWMWANILVF